MGIKTRFNPMGGISGDELKNWRYSKAANGQVTLYEYLGTYSSTKPLVVPTAKGNAVINDAGTFSDSHYQDWLQELFSTGYISVNTTSANVPFFNSPNLRMVDLQNVPFHLNGMLLSFYNSQNLTSVSNINPNVTNMLYTFLDCHSLNQNIQIPSSVTNMYYTFSNCFNLNQNIQISSSVIVMDYTFQGCSNLNQNIQIPSRVTSMFRTFQGCSNLNQNIQIPSSVTDIRRTFSECSKLNQNIQIPSSVTYMSGTFQNCTSLSGRTINIYSAQVSSASNCFYDTSATKNIWLPYRWINNTLTTTRNSFNSAGYLVGTGVGNSTINGCVMYDFVAGIGYPTYTGDGSQWILNEWAGSGSTVTVPQKITSYATFPTAVGNGCFQGNTSITQVNMNNSYIIGDSYHFNGCSSLQYITYMKASSSMTTYQGMFYSCGNLFGVSSGTSVSRTAHPPMPNTVTTARAMYGHCKNITNFYIDGFGVTTLYRTWNGCNTRDINVYISSPNVTNIAGVFYGYKNTYYKNIHIYFKYKNGVATKTFNAFNGSAFYRNNATTHCYMYNLGTCPV